MRKSQLVKKPRGKLAEEITSTKAQGRKKLEHNQGTEKKSLCLEWGERKEK